MKYIKFFLKFLIKKIFSFFIYLFLFILTIAIIFNIILPKEDVIDFNYSTLVINNINYPLEDKFNNSIEYIDGKNISFFEIYDAINQASSDDKIKSIYIDLDNVYFSTSQIEELKVVFDKFKSTGKKIYSFSQNLNNSNYLLASNSDIIGLYKSNSADITLNGYYKVNRYYKDIFDKYGFKMEVINIGAHKSFGEEYKNSHISKEQLETITRINDIKLYNFINEVSKARKINKDIFTDKLLNGEYSYINPNLARDLSLIDDLETDISFKEKYDILQNNSITIEEYIEVINKEKKYNSENQIAIIYLDGEIETSSKSFKPYISSKIFEEKLKKAKNLKNLKAIILRINSPGGIALEAKKIYDSIRKLNIPVYASVSNVAASGGYYIASSTDKIFANNLSIIGSIGVVSILPKVNDTLNKFNINTQIIKKGKYTGIFDINVNLTKEDKIIYQKKLENVYEEFKNDILDKRKILNNMELENIAQGKIWLGNEAINNKLIDEIGNLEYTINSLLKDLNISNNYDIVHIYSNKSYDNITEFITQKFFKTKKIVVFDELENELNFILNNNSKILYYLPKFYYEIK